MGCVMDQGKKKEKDQRDALFVSMVAEGVLRWPPVPEDLARLSRGRALPARPLHNTREAPEPGEETPEDIFIRR